MKQPYPSYHNREVQLHNMNLKLHEHNMLFPNQDYMPKGGYGNLIALPLQRQAVENGNSVFVDDMFNVKQVMQEGELCI